MEVVSHREILKHLLIPASTEIVIIMNHMSFFQSADDVAYELT